MKTKEIDRLLEKYYNGQALRRRMRLRNFLKQRLSLMDLNLKKALFRFFSENAPIPQPSEILKIILFLQ